MLSLPEVTLIAASSVEIQETQLALLISSNDIQYGAIKFLTSEAVLPADFRIEVISIPKLDIVGYSKFILNDLYRYVDTDYCLVVQADGFVLNASRWNQDFLAYDYIGAPWPSTLKMSRGDLNVSKNPVGNGGFSLRSKRLLKETAKIEFDNLIFPSKSEDLLICHFLYEKMVEAGIKFPAPELAAKFSIESVNASYGQNPGTAFGFHGKVLRDQIFQRIIKAE